MDSKHLFTAYPIEYQIQLTDFYSLFEIHYEYGFEFRGETHDFWECLFVCEGEVCVSADERIYNMAEGELIFHKPLEMHKFIVNGANGATMIIFSFSAKGPLTDWLRNKVFHLNREQRLLITSLMSYIKKTTGKNPFLTGSSPYKYNSCLSLFSHYPYFSQTISCYLSQLILSLAKNSQQASVSMDPDAVLFYKAVDYMNSSLGGQPSVSQIADHCSISVAGLKRLFEKYAGIGVHKYFLKLKIKSAIELLRSGESVDSVSKRLGFSSQSYFSKAFKRETGISPSQCQYELI